MQTIKKSSFITKPKIQMLLLAHINWLGYCKMINKCNQI